MGRGVGAGASAWTCGVFLGTAGVSAVVLPAVTVGWLMVRLGSTELVATLCVQVAAFAAWRSSLPRLYDTTAHRRMHWRDADRAAAARWGTVSGTSMGTLMVVAAWHIGGLDAASWGPMVWGVAAIAGAWAISWMMLREGLARPVTPR